MIIRSFALAALVAVPAGLALASSHDTSPATGDSATAPATLTEEQVRARLAEENFTLIRMERDSSYIEAYAMRENRQYEVKLNPVTGAILSIEAED